MIKFKLKVMLAMRDMNQQELAEAVGIRPATITAMVKGTLKELPLEKFSKMCEVLNCQPADLMEYIPDEPDNKKETAAEQ